MRYTLLAVSLVYTMSVVAHPILKERNGSASVKNVHCCDQVMNKHEASKAFGGLLALPDLAGNLGLGCSPIGITAASQCKSTPVICSKVYQHGLINAGCSPISAL